MKKFLFLLLPIILVIIIGGGLFFYSNLQGVCQKNCSRQVFVVPKGSSLNEVLEKLEKEKIIKNAFVAKIYLKLTNFKANIQAGDFKLNPQNNLIGVISSLQKGTLDFWVTIPEGFRVQQVYERVQEARGLGRVINQSDGESIVQYIKEEGYLFPDTYLIPKNASDEDIVKIMRNNFYVKIENIIRRGGSETLPMGQVVRPVPTDKIKLDNGDSITLQNLIILASLVEREAKNDEERPIIANIIYKRWKADWPLQVDATIQYAVGKSGEWWKKDLTFDDLKIDSPYNTYANKGLPPGPICNPGEKAISAVINQDQTDYWFYATGDDGVTRFSKTLGEHNQNVDKNIKN